eukprot:gene20112-22083_t
MAIITVYIGPFIFIVLSTLFNAIVFIVFMKQVTEWKLKDLLIVSMAASDALQTLLGYTTEIAAISLREKFDTYMLGIHLCRASGFILTFLALSSICHLAMLAYDRYLAVCKPFTMHQIQESPKKMHGILLSTWLYSLAWSIFPFLNWSGYELEADAMRCSINWASKQLKNRLYIVCLFLFCFFVPIFIMIFSFTKVKTEIKRMQVRAANLTGTLSQAAMETTKAEKKHSRLAVFLCAIFVVMWLPYALLSFWAAFFDHMATVPKFLGTAAAMIAKSSTIVNPIVYSFWHTSFRRSLMRYSVIRRLCCKTAVEQTGQAEVNTIPRTSNGAIMRRERKYGCEERVQYSTTGAIPKSDTGN